MDGAREMIFREGAADSAVIAEISDLELEKFVCTLTLHTMDPLKLLSRSTKLNKKSHSNQITSTPSAGQNANPQLFGQGTRKRKRGQDEVKGLNFFGDAQEETDTKDEDQDEQEGVTPQAASVQTLADLSLDESKALLREHKLKITWRNPESSTGKQKKSKKDQAFKKEKHQIFPTPLQSFSELHSRYSVSQRIVRNIHEQGYTIPTEVQLGALPLLLGQPSSYLPSSDFEGVDLLTVAPTGSGKTLAFLIPLLHQASKRNRDTSGISAVVLAPTKELVSQIVNEGRKLVQGTGLKITQVRRGMLFVPDESDKTTVKSDIIVSTPGLLQSVLESHSSPSTALQTVQHLVLDEADVLLDPLFRSQTLAIWTSLTSPSLRATLWSATIGSNIEELTQSTISSHQAQTNAPAAPLIRLVVGLKDSAIPNITHKLIYAATEQGKLLGLRQLLHPTSSSSSDSDSVSLKPPFLVFTQTIERAVALHSELRYDIPIEAGGSSRISVLHSDLSDSAREDVMTRFRRGEIWVLITTDLLARGVDFRGVNGVVNYDLPTSSAAYVHRVGRTGRAGREGGVAVTLYSKEDVPHLKGVANVVSAAEKQRGGKGGELQGWLFETLPSLSKGEKAKLKKRGVEGRSGRSAENKRGRKDRISTKAGFVRRTENNRKGAREASKKLKLAEEKQDKGEDVFEGFD